MRYIRINPKSLEADVVASKDDKAIYIPVRRERSGSAFTDLLHYTVRFDVLYPMVEAVDRKRGVRVKYSLHEADPWLVALAGITSMKVHARAGGQWAEQIVARSIRRIKCPPIPPKVFKELEQKPPLK